MSKKESQTTMFEHSEVKVKLLQTYLERYFNILNNSPYIGDIHYFDFFCAEGIYENGGKGSPIIALESIYDAFEKQKKKTGVSGKFNCLFNDFDCKKIETLKTNIANLKIVNPEVGKIEFSEEDYQILSKKVAKELKSLKQNEKAFVFIDPYGYKEIRISDIKNLLVNGKTEVLLFLPTHFMFRFSENATPESLFEFISELVPKDQWPKSNTGLEFIDNLKQGFKNHLGDNFYVDTFVISRDKNQFFCLFFFTSHIYGFDRMLDAKWKLDEEDGRGWKFEAAKPDLFSEIDKQPDISRFETELFNFLKTKRSNAEIYEFTLKNGHLPSHSNQLLKKWEEEGHLQVNLANGNPSRKSAFYISYKEFKANPKRVFIQIQK